MALRLFPTLALLLLLLLGCQREEAAAPTPPPPAVTTLTLKAQPVSLTRELPGRATPFRVAEVRPQVTGIVQQRLFEEGGLVQAGQPLYQLDDATYRAEFNRAKAAWTRAQAAAEIARIHARRAVALTQVDAVSRQENENAAAALAQAEAELGVAQAAVTGAEVVLGYTTIRSPISGRIGRSSVTQGALVTANQAVPLATVHQLDPIYVDLTQSSRELLELRKEIAAGSLQRPEDLAVAVLLEDGSRYRHEGKLAFAEVTVDPSTGSFASRVLVPNPEYILLPGMYVRAIVTTGVRDRALLVPQRAVSRDPRGVASVMLVTPGEKVEARPIEVSRTVRDAWLVESGLAEGERVIVEGLQKVRPGAQVQAVEHGVAPPDAPVPAPAAAANAPSENDNH